jgi:hypothetical protein
MDNVKTEETPQTKKPDYEVFIVSQSSNGKSFWTRIGAGWNHDDGKGMSVQLTALPVDGRIQIRKV